MPYFRQLVRPLTKMQEMTIRFALRVTLNLGQRKEIMIRKSRRFHRLNPHFLHNRRKLRIKRDHLILEYTLPMNWNAPQKPNDYAEQALITAVLDHTFPPGSTLPGERTLAADLGVTRPTLREAIQRLARDGWFTVRQGKATAVNDFWQDGGLNVLNTLVKHSDHLPQNFITHLLELRLHLAPAYTRAAVASAGAQLAGFLADYANLPDTAVAYASYDWRMHRLLTRLSGNPIYTLILNGFAGFYEEIAQLYFAPPPARARSRQYYTDLLTAVAANDADEAERLTRQVMQGSIQLWLAGESY